MSPTAPYSQQFPWGFQKCRRAQVSLLPVGGSHLDRFKTVPSVQYVLPPTVPRTVCFTIRIAAEKVFKSGRQIPDRVVSEVDLPKIPVVASVWCESHQIGTLYFWRVVRRVSLCKVCVIIQSVTQPMKYVSKIDLLTIGLKTGLLLKIHIKSSVGKCHPQK